MISLDSQQVLADLEQWIESFLSVASPAFNNLPPCPYAKKAWADQKVNVVVNPPLLNADDLHNHEAVIYVYDPADKSSAELTKLAVEFNQLNPSLVALEDHPSEAETVNQVVVNNQKYALIFIQPRDKLEHARKFLQAKGYYKHWDQDYYKSVVF